MTVACVAVIGLCSHAGDISANISRGAGGAFGLGLYQDDVSAGIGGMYAKKLVQTEDSVSARPTRLIQEDVSTRDPIFRLD